MTSISETNRAFFTLVLHGISFRLPSGAVWSRSSCLWMFLYAIHGVVRPSMRTRNVMHLHGARKASCQYIVEWYCRTTYKRYVTIDCSVKTNGTLFAQAIKKNSCRAASTAWRENINIKVRRKETADSSPIAAHSENFRHLFVLVNLFLDVHWEVTWSCIEVAYIT